MHVLISLKLSVKLALMLAFFATAAPRAENWPAWRGPSANGLSSETNLPVKWSKTEGITWRLPLPAWSGSTAIVWGDRIFLNVAEKGEELDLWSVDRNSGKMLWKQRLSGGTHTERKQNMSSPSPVTDGRHVWVMTGTGFLRASISPAQRSGAATSRRSTAGLD
jgi:hypothetical protein